MELVVRDADLELHATFRPARGWLRDLIRRMTFTGLPTRYIKEVVMDESHRFGSGDQFVELR